MSELYCASFSVSLVSIAIDNEISPLFPCFSFRIAKRKKQRWTPGVTQNLTRERGAFEFPEQEYVRQFFIRGIYNCTVSMYKTTDGQTSCTQYAQT